MYSALFLNPPLMAIFHLLNSITLVLKSSAISSGQPGYVRLGQSQFFIQMLYIVLLLQMHFSQLCCIVVILMLLFTNVCLTLFLKQLSLIP